MGGYIWSYWSLGQVTATKACKIARYQSFSNHAHFCVYWNVFREFIPKLKPRLVSVIPMYHLCSLHIVINCVGHEKPNAWRTPFYTAPTIITCTSESFNFPHLRTHPHFGYRCLASLILFLYSRYYSLGHHESQVMDL